jgi:hypothetical protein
LVSSIFLSGVIPVCSDGAESGRIRLRSRLPDQGGRLFKLAKPIAVSTGPISTFTSRANGNLVSPQLNYRGEVCPKTKDADRLLDSRRFFAWPSPP